MPRSAVKVAKKAVPTRPAGKVDGVTVSTGGVTVMLTVAGAETPPALLAV